MGQPNGYSAFSGPRPDTPARMITPSMQRRAAIVPESPSPGRENPEFTRRRNSDPFIHPPRELEEERRDGEDYPHAVYCLTCANMREGHGKLEFLGVFEDEKLADDAAVGYGPDHVEYKWIDVGNREDHGVRTAWVWIDGEDLTISFTVRRPVSDWWSSYGVGDEEMADA